MKTSDFLTTLRQHTNLPLLFRAGPDFIRPGYHLTEVKRVSYDTMDCGARMNRWTEAQFELWAPPHTGDLPGEDPMPADKFLRIVDRVEQELPLPGEAPARILAGFDGQPAVLHDIVSITPESGRLWVELSPDRARCKAAERRTPASPGGCCGGETGADDAGEQVEAGCGCSSPRPTSRAAAKAPCCA